MLRDGKQGAMIFLLGGVAALLLGVSLLRNSRLLGGAALLLGGAAPVVYGAARINDGRVLPRAVLLLGVALLLTGVAYLLESDRLTGVAAIVLAGSVAVFGGSLRLDGHRLGAVAFVVLAVVLALVGLGLLTNLAFVLLIATPCVVLLALDRWINRPAATVVLGVVGTVVIVTALWWLEKKGVITKRRIEDDEY